MLTHRDLRGNILIFKAKPKYEADIIPVILWYLFALWVYPTQLFQKAHVWDLGGESLIRYYDWLGIGLFCKFLIGVKLTYMSVPHQYPSKTEVVEVGHKS